MAGSSEGSHRLRRRREELALELFRHVDTWDVVARRIARDAVACAAIVVLVVAFYAAYVVEGFVAPERSNGELRDASLRGAVTIARDAHDVPHIVAAGDNDSFFAQGFAQGTDRLFQMEVTRRYAYGTLAEMLGARALPIDEEQRYYDVRARVARQWRELKPSTRADLVAFARGVNAAMQSQPLPVEFRLLLFAPQPWRPQDSLAVSMAVSIALGDSWRDVLLRNDVWRRYGKRGFDARFPLSDPRYDVSVEGKALPPSFDFGAQRSLPSETLSSAYAQDDKGEGQIDKGIAYDRTRNEGRALARATFERALARANIAKPRVGSNAWAAGGRSTADGRALLANDPHLELTIPGLWYLVDVRAPGTHVAGAAIPGVPGVALGHDDRVAWGATNADVAATAVYALPHPQPREWQTETFHVRFAGDVRRAYYRANGAFGALDSYSGNMVLVRIASLDGPSALEPFLALDRARNVTGALAALRTYRGPAENFIVADDGGTIAYHVAGSALADPAWGRFVQPAAAAAKPPQQIAFDALPAATQRRGGVLLSANNRMYGARYRYRLSATFDPPYRAYRIAELLRSRDRYDTSFFEAMQLDDVSVVDREFARLVAERLTHSNAYRSAPTLRAFASWNGAYAPGSSVATVEHSLRTGIEGEVPSLFAALQQLRQGSVDDSLAGDLSGGLAYSAQLRQPWKRAGTVHVDHPLAALHFGFLNGASLPGDGDEYTIHLQEPGFSQSFRAVWDVGNWDAGGIVIPSGESGRPRSKHYTDYSVPWMEGRMETLPFSTGAVDRATETRLTLVP